MNTNPRTVQFDRSAVKTVIAQEVVHRETLRTAIEHNPSFLRFNPAFLAVALFVGLNHPNVDETRREFEGKTEGKQVNDGMQYMKQVGLSLDTTGKVTGFINNSMAAVATPEQLDQEQARIFNNMITPQGYIEYLQAAIATKLQLDDTGKNFRTAAEEWLNHTRQYGTPDNNAHALCIVSAIQGKLNAQGAVAFIKALRKEHADVRQVPQTGIEAITQYQQTSGNRQHAQA